MITYTGYGSEAGARLLGRVVLSPTFSDTQIGKAAEEFLRRRGWRNFFTAACVHIRYELTFGDATVQGTSDRGGYVDHRVRGHGWSPAGGRRRSASRAGAHARAGPGVSRRRDVRHRQRHRRHDHHDAAAAPVHRGGNTFIRTESARQTVPGMAAFYRELLDAHPGSPLIFLSTGAWNTQPFLRRFLKRHRYPDGPMLLTDWGPTNTGWFRSGQQHKRQSLLQLSTDFPNVRCWWATTASTIPEIYGEYARNNPDRVRLIAIRQLNPTEQFLAHGTTEPLEGEPEGRHDAEVVEAPDGRGLLQALRRRNLLRA